MDDFSSVVRFPLPADNSVTERAEENDWLFRVRVNADVHAFRYLFDRLSPRVQSYLRRCGVAPVDAENVSQDVQFVVGCKAAPFETAEELRVPLGTIKSREWLDQRYLGV